MKIQQISTIKKSVGSAMVEYTIGVGMLGAFFILDDRIGLFDKIVDGLLTFYSIFMASLALPL